MYGRVKSWILVTLLLLHAIVTEAKVGDVKRSALDEMQVLQTDNIEVKEDNGKEIEKMNAAEVTATDVAKGNLKQEMSAQEAGLSNSIGYNNLFKAKRFAHQIPMKSTDDPLHTNILKEMLLKKMLVNGAKRGKFENEGDSDYEYDLRLCTEYLKLKSKKFAVEK
ncbi:unnamed protein product [Cercopithifilaria johnstoni]|uniref:Uncharacterized protein n=1 Tax=Cercopithifilaria johnstoni TaxID=2874296 RepID=A0A8J2M0X2_9BILA|nr:unnamed protein product [Cercopithifilaria johnstoni]